MTTTNVQPRPTPRREVRARRVSFDFGREGIPRHFLAGDILQSHLLSLGSAVFPEGEDFFVRSVRNFRDAVTDPELSRQVAGFIGQEAMHGRAHRQLNEHLGRLGYPTRALDRCTGSGLRLLERLAPKQVSLAVTAALEHYTATLAEVVLTDPEARAAHLDEAVRDLFVWHALEETEHKAVAFDVFQAVSGDQRVRIGVMRLVTLNLLIEAPLALAWSLLRDPAARHPRRLYRSIRALSRSPFAKKAVLDHLRDYNRADFHPDDHDTTALVAEWRARLLDSGGALTRWSEPVSEPTG